MTVQEAAAKVAAAETARSVAAMDLRMAIRHALEAGVPKKRIAEDAGISRNTLYKMLKED